MSSVIKEKRAMIVPDRFYRISVKALVLNPTRDKFLVIQEAKNRKWDLLGGGLEFGESPHECLLREIREEMNVPVLKIAQDPSYFFTGQFQSESRRGQWYANVFYLTELGHLDFTPSDECVACGFVSPAQALALESYSSVGLLAKQFKC